MTLEKIYHDFESIQAEIKTYDKVTEHKFIQKNMRDKFKSLYYKTRTEKIAKLVASLSQQSREELLNVKLDHRSKSREKRL